MQSVELVSAEENTCFNFGQIYFLGRSFTDLAKWMTRIFLLQVFAEFGDRASSPVEERLEVLRYKIR